MSEFRIFYAWQSDRPANLCRSLIRQALDNAAEKLQDDLAIDDAPRVEIDQDTQGAAGSPLVAETIFRKIRECDAFVADLTFTGKRTDDQESPAPNPNVLVEYGYALHALGEERIIAVFNKQFGNPEDLPFDLRHRRWPIRFRTSGDGSDEKSQAVRRSERTKLAGTLTQAIKTIVQKEGKRVVDSIAADTRPLVEEFPLADGIFLEHPGRKYRFPNQGTKILLSLHSGQGGQGLTNGDVIRIAHQSLKPLASRFLSRYIFGRVPNGAAKANHPGSNDTAIQSASILLRDGSLYGIDCCHVGSHKHPFFPDPYVPAQKVETILRDGLHNFLEVAKSELRLALPLKAGVALEGVKDYYLGVDKVKFFDGLQGPILVERIEDRFQIEDYEADRAGLLKQFFEKIYDEAGLERP